MYSKELFKQLNNVKSELKADGNNYSSNFTFLAITIKTKSGKIVDYYSASQKNVTGLYNQGVRFLGNAKKTHTVIINVS